MCCGASAPSSGAQQAASASRGFDLAMVPDVMELLEYLGNGSEVWGGPGVTPSKHRYSFSQQDNIKYVDGRDVDWFLERTEKRKKLFKRHETR